MIKKLYVDGLKCHSNLSLKLTNLNLLVGTNSSGKSTVIQAILLLTHNISSNAKSSPLNGHLVSIGDFKEAKNQVTNAKKIEIKISSQSDILGMTIEEDPDLSEGRLKFNEYSKDLQKFFTYANANIHYLSAHRTGNQNLHYKNFDNVDLFGIYGEYAIDYLQTNKSRPLIDHLQAYDKTATLGGQVNYWLQKILGHSIQTSEIEGTDIIKAEFTNFIHKIVRAKNTGSGISYTISILIVCLSAKPGDLIIIENPEIHLHPKAQSLLAEFFVYIANAGIQLIIETHSDHIFNGTRVQIYNKKIGVRKVACHFFYLDQSTAVSKHTQININKEGRIENQQRLLFDQFDFDINTLVGLYGYRNQ